MPYITDKRFIFLYCKEWQKLLKMKLMKGDRGHKLKMYKRTQIAHERYPTSINQFSHSVLSNSLLPHGLQHTRPPCPSPTIGVYSNSCPLSWCCHPTISSSFFPFSSHLNLSQHQGLFKWVSSLHQAAKVLEFQLQHQSFQWLFRIDFL